MNNEAVKNKREVKAKIDAGIFETIDLENRTSLIKCMRDMFTNKLLIKKYLCDSNGNADIVTHEELLLKLAKPQQYRIFQLASQICYHSVQQCNIYESPNNTIKQDDIQFDLDETEKQLKKAFATITGEKKIQKGLNFAMYRSIETLISKKKSTNNKKS